MPGGALYGASGDFNKFNEEDIRWVNANELSAWQADSRPLVIIDCRPDTDYKEGTIPGAVNLSQHQLFLDYQTQLPRANEIVALADSAQADFVLFANTGGVAGAAAGRDLYVLNFLNEVTTPTVAGPRAGWAPAQSRSTAPRAW